MIEIVYVLDSRPDESIIISKLFQLDNIASNEAKFLNSANRVNNRR